MARKKYPQNPWHPRYWSTWLTIAALHLAAWLPWPAKMVLGRGLGYLALVFARQRRHYTEVNIRLCFPEKSPQEQAQLVRDIFIANGIGLLETATALTRDVAFMKDRLELRGREHLEQAMTGGRGVILLGIHFPMIDLGGALQALFYRFDAIYKPNKNPVFDRFIQRGRAQHYEQMIGHHDLKTLVRRVRQGHSAWYSPDQDFGRKVSVFAPFFGVQAATITMTARMARMTGAAVVPARFHRNPDNRTYVLEYFPALEQFPSGDEVADATQVNAVIEQLIRMHPDQYLWMHRRFKTRPDPSDPKLY